MIRVLIADDHEVVRAGLKLLLEKKENIEVIGEAGSGQETLSMCGQLNPDIVLLDLDLPDIDGLEVTQRITSLSPNVKILILTMHDNVDYAMRLVRAGVSGFVLKGEPSQNLLTAIRKVGAGGTYVTPSISEKITFRLRQPQEENPVSLLSDRELLILVKLAQGNEIKEIAKEICLSPKTVETYKSRTMRKLGLRNISDLTRFAITNGMINKY